MKISSTVPRCGGWSTTCTSPSGNQTTTDKISNNQLNTGPPLARLAMKFQLACATADNNTSTSPTTPPTAPKPTAPVAPPTPKPAPTALPTLPTSVLGTLPSDQALAVKNGHAALAGGDYPRAIALLEPLLNQLAGEQQAEVRL